MGERYYEPFDQHDWLGSPPWKEDDPAVLAWESAHGHDVRLKCYVEFGCQVIEDSLERHIESLKILLDSEKHAHKKDNEFLLARAEQAEAERDEARSKSTWDGTYHRLLENFEAEHQARIAAEEKVAELERVLSTLHGATTRGGSF